MWISRIIWFVLWVLSILGISFYGGALSFGFFWFMTLIPVVSALYLFIVYLKFRVHQNMEGHELVANHPHPILFSLQNETRIPFAGVRVDLFSDFSEITGQEDAAEYELMPGTGIRNEAELVCRYRGEYDVGVKSLTIEDYLRLFKVTYRYRSPLRVLVKPDLISLSELSGVDESVLTTANTPQNATEPDVLSRKYENGDDIRHMNWKASASQGKLMLRKRIGEEQQGITVMFATHRTSDKPAEYLPTENKCLECALALCLFFVKKNMTVNALWVAEKVRTHSLNRLEQFDALYGEIARVEFKEDLTNETLFSAAYRSHEVYRSRAVFIVLTEWSPEALVLSEMLNRHGIASEIYLISADADAEKLTTKLPRTGVHVFSPEAKLTEVM